jgi:hypothetical protein
LAHEHAGKCCTRLLKNFQAKNGLAYFTEGKEFCAADSMRQQMTTNTFINIIISCKSKFPQEGENVSLVLKNVRDVPGLVEW